MPPQSEDKNIKKAESPPIAEVFDLPPEKPPQVKAKKPEVEKISFSD